MKKDIMELIEERIEASNREAAIETLEDAIIKFNAWHAPYLQCISEEGDFRDKSGISDKFRNFRDLVDEIVEDMELCDIEADCKPIYKWIKEFENAAKKLRGVKESMKWETNK